MKRTSVAAAGIVVVLGQAVLMLDGTVQAKTPPSGPDTVVKVDAGTGEVQDVIAVGQDPLALTVAGGSVWTHNVEDGTLSLVDPARSLATVIRLGDVVGMTAAGNDLWVAHRGNRLARLDGRTGRIERTLRIGSKRLFAKRDAGFVAFARGALWITLPVLGQNQAPQRLVRVDQSSAEITASIPIPADPAPPLVAGRYLWILGRYDNVVARVDMITRRVRTVATAFLPFGTATGAGSIWIAHDFGKAVWRVDPASLRVRARIGTGERARGIAFGRGRVWVTTETGLLVVDPQTNRIVRRVLLSAPRQDDGPIGVAVLDRTVWVSVE